MPFKVCEDFQSVIFSMFMYLGGLAISQLLEWLRWHFTDGERLFSDIKKEELPENHSEYWDCVSTCIGY